MERMNESRLAREVTYMVEKGSGERVCIGIMVVGRRDEGRAWPGRGGLGLVGGRVGGWAGAWVGGHVQEFGAGRQEKHFE